MESGDDRKKNISVYFDQFFFRIPEWMNEKEKEEKEK